MADSIARHTAERPCPVCGGYDRMPRGRGERCFGFVGSAGWVHCSREDHAGRAKHYPRSSTYAHREAGDCPCGVVHGTGAPAMTTAARPKKAREALGKFAAAYQYRDEAGTLLFEAVRFESPKSFGQRRPDATAEKGWAWNLKGVRRVLYRLPELLAADPAEMVLVPEGEKDVDRLRALGFTATCNPMGAKKWRDEYSDALKGRDVAILADNDDDGRQHAQQVARAVASSAASVRVVALPDLPAGGDVSDWLDALGTAADLRRLIDAAPPWMPSPAASGTAPPDDEAPGAPEKPARVPASSLILALTTDLELFHTPDDRAYAVVPVDGHAEIHSVLSTGFRRWVRHGFFARHGRAASEDALREALGTIEGKAHYEGDRRDVYVRVGAGPEGAVYLDLADTQWRVVEITGSGWSVLDRSPIPFRRTGGTQPLPEPEPGGPLELARRYLNLADEDAWRLVVAWLTMALRPVGPYPVLILQGEQGSAKSTTARVLRSLIDPHSTTLKSEPRNDRDLMIGASANWCFALDNLGTISDWLSDALCRLATGGGFSTRQLYADEDEINFVATRPILINGIDSVATRPDLLDRGILLTLPKIAPEARREEAELWAEFQRDRGLILGALLDAACAGMRLLPSTKLDRLPRMADFARWGEAVGRAVGWGEGGFLAAYQTNIGSVTESAADGSAVASAVRELMAGRSEWVGTTAELLTELSGLAGDGVARSKLWPQTPRALTAQLARYAGVLRSLGVECSRGTRTGRGRPMVLTSSPSDGGRRPSLPSLQSPEAKNKPLVSDGRGDGCDADLQPSPRPSPEIPGDLAASDCGDGSDGPGHRLGGDDDDPWSEDTEWTAA